MSNKEIMSKEIMNLKKKLEAGNFNTVKDFWNKIEEKGAPIIEEIDGDTENDLVTFIYKGNDETKNILLYISYEYESTSDYKFDEHKFERLLDTNIWYKTYKIRNDVRFNYLYFVNDPLDDNWERRWQNIQHDDLNKNKLVFAAGEEEENVYTYVVMPKADEQIWVKERKDTLKGNEELFKFQSKILNNERRIRIYTPSGYSKSKEPYGILVLNDGEEYMAMSAKAVLDNLINDKKIPPIVTVFIESINTRDVELTCNDDFVDFTEKEVIPWVKKNYNVSDNPEKNIIGGLSYGGLTASYIGLKCSHIFGNVLSQSGSYWFKEEDMKEPTKRNWMARQYEAVEKLNLKFYMNVGILEGEEMLGFNKDMRDRLIAKGYDVFYEEFKSAHDYLSWGETLANGLISLIGK